MFRTLFRFSILITSLLIIVFAIHVLVLYYLKLPLYADKIIAAYLINVVLAITIYVVMLALKNKYQSQLGFIFMFGSALKFVVFFIAFYPFYKADGIITKTEFAAFFTPYAICLIIETTSLSKWLNKLG